MKKDENFVLLVLSNVLCMSFCLCEQWMVSVLEPLLLLCRWQKLGKFSHFNSNHGRAKMGCDRRLVLDSLYLRFSRLVL